MAVSRAHFKPTFDSYFDHLTQILLGERAHLIEFPSLLLPPGATTGSIVNISVTQNVAEEHKRDREFWELQSEILEEFGRRTPKAPQISVGSPFSQRSMKHCANAVTTASQCYPNVRDTGMAAPRTSNGLSAIP